MTDDNGLWRGLSLAEAGIAAAMGLCLGGLLWWIDLAQTHTPAETAVSATDSGGVSGPTQVAPGEWRIQDAVGDVERDDCAADPEIDDLRLRAGWGDANAQHMLARAYRTGRGRGVSLDYELSAIWYRRAAEQGHVGAQAMTGRMHAFGWGVPRDQAVAAEWYRRAAEQGHAEAQSWLGDLRSYGGGVPQDDVIAAAWHRRAAEQGHASAQWWLGGLYALGRGVPQDDVEALSWYILAAPRDPLARESRDELAARLGPEAVMEAQRRARAFRPSVEIDSGCVP